MSANLHLPQYLTSFVGRERELDGIRRLLATARLLTLSGPGGSGKTRLAIQVAGDLAPMFPDGVWFVPFSHVTDPDLVILTIAQALGVPVHGLQSAQAALVGFLSGKRALLV